MAGNPVLKKGINFQHLFECKTRGIILVSDAIFGEVSTWRSDLLDTSLDNAD